MKPFILIFASTSTLDNLISSWNFIIRRRPEIFRLKWIYVNVNVIIIFSFYFVPNDSIFINRAFQHFKLEIYTRIGEKLEKLRN